MKIAAAAAGKEIDSIVDENAGRAPYYLIFDDKGKLIESLKNPFSIGGGGAGWGVAKMLADKGVGIAIAGKFGPNMVQALDQRGVKHIEGHGTAKGAVMKALKE